MNILYIHQYFRTPDEGGAIRSYYLAKGLVDHGYNVEMITSHNQKKYLYKEIEGIKVHYLPVSYKNEYGFTRRIYSFIRFYFLAIRHIGKLKGFELIYATSTPLTVGWLASKLKKKYGIPYIFEARDLWPEAPIQMGAIKSQFLKKWLRNKEKQIYQGADKIIALSPGIRNSIFDIVPNKPIIIIPNMSDCKFFKPSTKNQQLVEKYDLKGKFVVGYFGAIGLVNKLDFFLDFIKAANEINDNFAFLIIGRGGDLKHLIKKANKLELNNLHFIPFQNKTGIKELLTVMDAAYISFDNKPVLETNSPNKYFDAIAAGKLIITNIKGWIKEITENHQCGIYANPLSPQSGIVALEKFHIDKNLLLAYQKNARKLAEQHYARQLQIKKLIGVLNNEHHFKINDDEVYILTA